MHEHIEKHGKFSYVIRDAVIGLSDGLTVPFALAAGLSGATDSSLLVVTAGVAEIAAGAIAMGLGGYMAARSEADNYNSERRREAMEVEKVPEREVAEVIEILEEYGIPKERAELVTDSLKQNHEKWVDFMMRFELGLEKPDAGRLVITPLTIGFSYIVGGLIPLFPYFIYNSASAALPVSIATTLVALFVFGFGKGIANGVNKWKSSLQTAAIGGLAAAVAFGAARLLGG